MRRFLPEEAAAQPATTAKSTLGQCKVAFSVTTPSTLPEGQLLKIVGSVDALGAWAPEGGLQLSRVPEAAAPNAHQSWTAECDLDVLEDAGDVEFKVGAWARSDTICAAAPDAQFRMLPHLTAPLCPFRRW